MAAPKKGQLPRRVPVPVTWFVDTAGVVNFSVAVTDGADVLLGQVEEL